MALTAPPSSWERAVPGGQQDRGTVSSFLREVPSILRQFLAQPITLPNSITGDMRNHSGLPEVPHSCPHRTEKFLAKTPRRIESSSDASPIQGLGNPCCRDWAAG